MVFTSENAFLGAKISKGKETLYVYKVNGKSFYAGSITYPQFEERYSNRPAKQTFKDFCSQNGFKMLTYDGFEISEDEVKRKESAPAKQKKSVVIGKAERLVIQKVLADFAKKKKDVRLLSFDVGKRTMRILCGKGPNLLLNIDGKYYLYNTETEKTAELGLVYDVSFSESTVPWEQVA